MRKLLSADSRHLIKNKLFWLELISCAIFSAWIMFANYSPKIQESTYPMYLENTFFNMYQLLCIVFASAISLIAGTEYSDGIIRNKLIVGHTRTEIYFSILLTNVWASIAVITTHGIVSYGTGYFLFGAFQISAAQILAAILCALLANLVFTTLFVAIALNCSNKSVTAVVSILSSLVIIFVANYAGQKLSEPEMIHEGITITDNAIQHIQYVQYGSEMVPNPDYVTGTLRNVYEFIYNLLPTGQLMQIQSLEFAHWQYMSVLSVFLFAVITIVGYKLFAKKDIK